MRALLRPLPRAVTRPVSILFVIAWIAVMALVINRSYLQASTSLAADLARYGSAAVWRGVSVVKPNELEAEVLSGIAVTDLSSAELAARWFLDCGAATTMITRGSRGALVVGAAGVEDHRAFAATPVDTTAAGDAFTGALGASLAQGASLPEAVRRGLAAGALAVTVRGASPSLPTAEAVDAFLAAQR